MNESILTQRIDGIIRLFLYILIFWLPYSNAVVESCVILCLILWLIKRGILFYNLPLKNEENKESSDVINAFKPSSSFLNRPISFFVFICILSLTGSVYLQQSLQGFLTKTLEWFIVYFLVIEAFQEKKHIMIALLVFIFSTIATSLDGIIQFHVTGKDIFSGFTTAGGGATAGFRHSNDLGGYLSFVVPLLFSLLFAKQSKGTLQSIVFLLFVITTWSLVITFSRASWIANVVGLLFCLFLLRRKLLSVFVFYFAVVSISFYMISPTEIKHRFKVDTKNIQSTKDWRAEIWVDTLKMIKERPLFGHGLNTYMKIFQVYRIKPGENTVDNPTYAHNCYLQLTSETGVLGLTGFLWIFGQLFVKMIRANRAISKQKVVFVRETGPRNGYLFKKEIEANPLFFSYLLVGSSAGILTFLVHCFFDTDLYTLKLSILLWYMVGINVALYNLLVTREMPTIKLATVS